MADDSPAARLAAALAANPAAVQLGAWQELSYIRFKHFARYMWSAAVPSAPEVVWGRHMDAICDEIQEVLEEADRRRALRARILAECGPDLERAASRVAAELGDLPPLRLVLLIPPRHSKSALVECLLPAWRWLHRPQDQILALSASQALVEDHGMHLRDVLRDPRYAGIQAHLVRTKRLPPGLDAQGRPLPDGVSFGLRPDQFAKATFDTTAGGGRDGYPLNAGFTGVNSDITVIDDPHDIDDAFGGSPASQVRLMQECRQTYKDKVQDRLNEKLWGVILLIMQRVHPQDLADYMITTGARVVCLPAEYDPGHPHAYVKDWRQFPGDELDPLRQPRGVLDHLKRESPRGYATKYLMRPSVQEGVRYKRGWLTDHHYDGDPAVVAAQMEEILISVDSAQKTGARNDYTSMGVWGRLGQDRYLLDRVYDKFAFPALVDAFVALCHKWPRATFKLVEDKSSGTDLIALCSRTIPGIVPIEPGRGGKEARSVHGEAAAQLGHLRTPRPGAVTWNVLEYVENLVAFGGGGLHDDDVDMTSQAMARWAESIAPWLAQWRAGMIDPAPTIPVTALLRRWQRPDMLAPVWIGLVPGWCEGQSNGEATATLVDKRGRMVALLECAVGGQALFLSALQHECELWQVREVRYADIPGRPSAQMARELAHAGVPVAGKRQHGGGPSKLPGQPGAGWLASAGETAELWSAFLRMLAEGLVGVRDAATLRALDEIVETDGRPTMADGRALGGRALALLLALYGRSIAVATEPEHQPKVLTLLDSQPVDLWSAGLRRGVHMR